MKALERDDKGRFISRNTSMGRDAIYGLSKRRERELTCRIKQCIQCNYAMIEEDNVKCMEPDNQHGDILNCPIYD